ncbi:TraB/GumN family protein [Parasphingopyxis sp.]|uniref:TraB/GumN family protein n=1 Tax=Parasphingopyxis sp. TaxID=1920299 RepID=UPI0026341CEE|nr:TraB/GumN family protein [Parasphingopyxis sp.]
MKLKMITAALTGIFLTACAQAQAPQTAEPAPAPVAAETAPEISPALWRIADEDTTIWLFGTIHILPTGFEWRNATIDAAIAESDNLVIETVISGEQSDAALLLMRLGISPDLPPIGERVDEDVQAELAAMIERGPFPESFLNGLETWAAALMLVQVTLADLGLDPESGVEEQLELMFELAEKPISGLETPAEQLGFFDTLPEEAQRYFLSSVVGSVEEAREEFAAMLSAWRRGDEAAIAEAFDGELVESDPLREALLTRRNANWAEWIEERLAEPGTVFMAVGAGHLAGQFTVQDFLAEAGIAVERVQ